MEALLSSVPQLIDIVQKGGIVGVLLAIVVWQYLDRARLQKEARKTYKQRDHARLCFTIVKAAADTARVPYDLRPADDLLKEDGAAPA